MDFQLGIAKTHRPPGVEAFAVARQHCLPSQQVMPERHRLGDLQMRKARHRGGRISVWLVGKLQLQAM